MWLQTRLRCDSITPFGNPVVPLEYGNATSWSGVTPTDGASLGASPTTSSYMTQAAWGATVLPITTKRDTVGSWERHESRKGHTLLCVATITEPASLI